MELIEKIQQKAEEKVDTPSPAAFLLGAQAAVAAVFTTLQVTGDLYSRMVANHPKVTGLAIGFGVVASVLALAALILGSWISKGFLLAGVASFLVGATCAIIAATLVSSDRGKPIVTITRLEGTRVLEASVKLSNVKTRETIHVLVEPLDLIILPEGSRYERVKNSSLFYETAFGPDKQGEVDRALKIDLPPGSFSYIGIRAWVGRGDDCYDESSKTTSCETRKLIRRPERPQLSAMWKGPTARPRLSISVTARDLTPDTFIYVRVRGRGGSGKALATLVLAPDLGGSIARTLSVVVSRRLFPVCVEASTSKTLRDPCRSMRNQETAWIRLAVPPKVRSEP